MIGLRGRRYKGGKGRIWGTCEARGESAEREGEGGGGVGEGKIRLSLQPATQLTYKLLNMQPVTPCFKAQLFSPIKLSEKSISILLQRSVEAIG